MMAYNQYYGGQENYMPMQNQSYFQPNVMSPTPHTPRIGPSTPMTQPPQTTPMMQMNQMQPMNQMPPMNPIPQINTAPQVNQMPQSNAQYQYANNSAMNYVPPVSPMTQTPIASNHYEMQSGMMNQMPSNTTPQNYSPPVNQPQFPAMPQNQTAGVYPSTNVYNANNQVGYNNMALPQTSNVPGMMTNNAFTDQQQYGVPMSQQMSYPTNGNVQPMSQMPITQTQPVYAGEPCNPQSTPNPAQPTAPAKQEEPDTTFKPTNVIGQYKCSDFPTLYSGNYRYNESPIQRKPFTMKGESLKPHGQTDRRTNIGLNRYGKRWELRGGKYYGCFTSRTNGLQDICPKAKCRLCPNENKKK
ncbi:hypothetical protein WA026_019239 [Henosepilachna vigintioctopunctata]|uniref:Uncharacterized protein n=1 Tax=Henosepilachna vigintioctopunctata TaxID=420089 RepID=A0AAW1V3W6_9CUCU